jgi:hypothetical protein
MNRGQIESVTVQGMKTLSTTSVTFNLETTHDQISSPGQQVHILKNQTPA